MSGGFKSDEWWVVSGGFKKVVRGTWYVVRRRRLIWRLVSYRLVTGHTGLFWLPFSVLRPPSLRVWRLASGVWRLRRRTGVFTCRLERFLHTTYHVPRITSP
jgi:hypothetical protein